MGAPRAPLNPTTHSVGLTAKLVTVTSVSPDGATAITTDRQGTQTAVPMLIQRSKGPLPAVGETWLIAQDLGLWTFAAISVPAAALLPAAAASQVTVSAQVPEAPAQGDVWLNSAQGNAVSSFDGASWVAAPLGAGAIAPAAVTGTQVAPATLAGSHLSPAAGITAGQVAFTAADIGGATITTGTAQPDQPVQDELWVNPDAGNQLAVWNGDEWVPVQFGAQAIAPASLTSVQIAAEAGILPSQVSFTASGIGGVTTSVGFDAPAGPSQGDLWFNGNQAFQLQQWNGIAWVNYQFGTQAIAAGSVTAALIAANTITATQIASGTITSQQIAAGSITAAVIAANTITGGNIAASTITTANLGPGAVQAVNVAANQFGLNMVADPTFSNAPLNAIRAASPSSGAWTLGSGNAVVTGSSHSAVLYLTPPGGLWLNPGEQYYVSVSVTSTTSTGASVGIGIENSALTASVNDSVTFSGGGGTQQLSGVVTIPPGFGPTGFIRLFVSGNGSGLTPVVTFSSPVCQPASLFSPTITGTDWIINSQGEFYYSGVPAANNLSTSNVPGTASVTDKFGNVALPGSTQYLKSGPTYLAIQSYQDTITLNFGTSQAAWTVANAFINFFHNGTGNDVITIAASVLDITPGVLAGALQATDPVAGAPAGESWHSPSLANGWTGSFRYKLTIDNAVWITGVLSPPSTYNGVVFTLPSAYWPATTQDFPLGAHNSVAWTDGVFGRLTTAGQVTIQNGNNAMGAIVVNIRIPLD